MRIGSKTLFTATAAIFTGVAAWAFDLVGLDWLGALDTGSALLVGCFATLMGAFVYRVGRLDEPSESCLQLRHRHDRAVDAIPLWSRFVLGANDGQAYDLPGRVHQGVCLAAALTLALITLAGPTLIQLRDDLGDLTFASSGLCPEEKAAEVQKELPPGCELVMRAFEMGLAESLGRCEINQARQARARAVCLMRQRDEPTLHYTYRLLEKALESLRNTFRPSTFAGYRRELEVGTQHLETLSAAQWQVLASKARASHHVFTSLPDPRPWLLALGGPAFARTQCLDRYQGLEHRPEVPSDAALMASVRLDHILGQLLFDTRYEPAAGFCREYTVHWGSPPDACAQLAQDPEGFLSSTGAWDHVSHLVDRYETSLAVARIAGEAQTEDELRWVVPQRFVSFQCYHVEPRQAHERRTLPVNIGGHVFNAEELRVFPVGDDAPPIELYNEIASLLIPGFHYGDLESGATLAGAGAVTPQRFLRGQDGYLSRLEYFGDVDVYAGQGWWVLLRDDLWDVYPHHVHMAHFVEAFRMQYRLERGRL